MKKFLVFIIIAAVLFSIVSPAALAADRSYRTLPDYSIVRAQLCSFGTELKELEIEIVGIYTIRQTGDKLSDKKLTVKIENDKLALVHSETSICTAPEIDLIRESNSPDAGYISLPNGRKYLGSFNFKIKTASDKYIQIINTVPTVQYLYGVLAGEMGNDTPADALKAQALCAKSYVLADKSDSNEYDVGDTSRTQVYRGYNSAWGNIISAVNATADEVVFYNDKILETYYASSNGGETDIPSHAWGSGCTHLNPGYGIAIDDFDFASTGVREDLVIQLGKKCDNIKLESLLMLYASKVCAEQVVGILSVDKCSMTDPRYEGVERNMTNAHFDITAETENSTKKLSADIPVDDLLKYGVFSNTALRCYWGEQTESNTYKIYHVRNGHGVGLSQRAAKYRAMLGQDYREILEFYFPGSEIGILPSVSSSLSGENSTLRVRSEVLSKTKEKLTEGGKVTAAVEQTEQMSLNHDGYSMQPKSIECYAYSKVQGAYMHSAASSDSVVINRLAYGEMLLVCGISGEWVHVQTTGGMIGYVEKGSLEFITKAPTSVTYKLGKVAYDSVNFRSEPDTGSTSYGKLAKNTQLYVWGSAGQGNEWYYVQCGLTYGYVYAEYVETSGTYTANEIADGSVIASGLTKSNVYLRPKPSTNNDPIKTLAGGTYVLIYSLENGWYNVYTDGLTGYVSESYIDINTALPIAPKDAPHTPAQTQPIGIGTVNATNVRFRSAPDTSTSSNIIRLLQRGDRLTLFSLENNWYYASYEGEKGYISAQYVDITPITPPEVTEGELVLAKGITTGSVNFREGAGLSYAILKNLAKNTTFEIIGECGTWYFIRYDGICGFVSKKYATLTDDGNVGVIQVEEDWKSYTTKTVGDVNLRLGPSVFYTIIEEIEEGQSVTVLAITGEWCLCTYGGKLGYVSHSYLKK